MNKYRHLEVERFNARMPDGRLLLIEKTRDLGYSPKLQYFISMALMPIVFISALFGGLFIPAVMFAGFGSYLLFVFAAVIVGVIAQNKLIGWLQNFDTQADTCEVVGMDCSTEELLAIFHDTPSHHPIQRSVH